MEILNRGKGKRKWLKGEGGVADIEKKSGLGISHKQLFKFLFSTNWLYT